MKAITKNMWRAIAGAKGRFVAIILIILLGCQIFVGVKAAGPGLNESMTATVQGLHLSDVQLFSNTGFTTKDVAVAEQVTGAQAEAVAYKPVVGEQKALGVSLYGYRPETTINQLRLTSGRLPEAPTEVVLDHRAQTTYHYKLGQHFTFAKAAGLKHRKYRIVGFADSPLYIENTARGATNVGDGTLRLFAYIPEAELHLKAKTLLNVRFEALQSQNTFDAAYQAAVDKRLTALKKVFKKRDQDRSQALLAEAMAPLTAQQATLAQNRQQLDAAQAQGADVDAQRQALDAAQKRLAEAQNRAKQAVKTTYTWQTRADLIGFTAYGEASERIATIANVFPVFFFLIAALITFTTITRMIEEARGQIGVFKALGYGRFAIAQNYLHYALLGGLIGASSGSLLGNVSLPRLVLALYHTYIPQTVVIRLQWGPIAWAVGLALLATVGAAGLVIWRELNENPAQLLLPKVPKAAKRILLERIKPLWRRLTFNQKVSYRNLFRYKSRMVMTIVGIAGGCALILTGFGIRDSIQASATRQYQDIIQYQAVVALPRPTAAKAATEVLATTAQYQSSTPITTTAAKLTANGHQVNDVHVYVPKTAGALARYVQLFDATTGKRHALAASGVTLGQKTADRLGVQPGATLNVTLTAGHQARVKVAAIVQNYVGQYAYMSASAYRQAFGQTAAENTLLVRLKPQSEAQLNRLAKQLLASGSVKGTSYTADQRQSVDTMAANLSPVIAIFVLLSAGLSFVVLYNLTNINVSERIRELSTIKVLGFYDREVTMYIARENIVMTIIGIIVGYGVGNALTAFILNQAATAQVNFPLTIHFTGYAVATVLTVTFTGIVMAVTHRHLKKVDMIKALQANE